MGIYVCVAVNMVGERESEKAQLSVFGKKSDIHSLTGTKKNKVYVFFLGYLLHTSTYGIYHSVKSIFSMLCVLPTSRTTSVCAAACEPGGLG